ncbi:MAG: LCP family protein [Mycobacteriales bacterium]
MLPEPGRPAGASPPPRRRAARVLSWIAVVTSVAVLATAGGGYALLNYYDGNINRIDVFGLGDGDRPAAAPRDAKNILIVGSDSRGDLKAGEGTQGKGKDFVTGQRSDTVILAHLYGNSDTAQLVSFPRDSWVTIPAHVSEQSGQRVAAREEKLNVAIFEGGPALLIRTIEKLTDLRVDNYLQVDFDGFQAMVNTLGGVEVCLSKPAKEKDSGIDLEAGRQVIQGDQALAFVRQRKGLPRGDLDRIARQQQFIGAIVRETLSAGTLLNPFKLNSVIKVATESLQVDESLSIGDLRDLALRFKGFDAGGVIFSTVPVADIGGRRQGQDVVLLDKVKMAQFFDTLRRDVPPDTPEPPDSDGAQPGQPLIVAPGAIRVKVSNGTAVQGLGRRAYDDLAAVGFQLVGQPDSRGDSATGTTVFHGPDKGDSARTVAASIPGATTQLDPSLTRTLEVVIGSGYSGARAVTVGAASAAPSPAGSPGPQVQTAAADPCAI